jgi:hypothetical protein
MHGGGGCGAVSGAVIKSQRRRARCYNVGRLDVSGMNGGRLKVVGNHSIFISLSNASAVVQVEHRLPSGWYPASGPHMHPGLLAAETTLSFTDRQLRKFRIALDTRLVAGQ